MSEIIPPENLLDHKTKLKTIGLIVKEEVMKGNPKMWAREVKLINQLIKSYPDRDFWLNLHLGFSLHSLAWFKLPEGAVELEKSWRFFKLQKSQKKTLDVISKPDIVSVNVPELPKKISAIEWAN